MKSACVYYFMNRTIYILDKYIKIDPFNSIKYYYEDNQCTFIYQYPLVNLFFCYLIKIRDILGNCSKYEGSSQEL